MEDSDDEEAMIAALDEAERNAAAAASAINTVNGEDEEEDDDADDAAMCAALDIAEQQQRQPPAGSSPPPPPPLSSSGSGSSAGLCVTLQRYFGFDAFRPGQLEVVDAILSGRDVAVFWATGQGKSLCYQVPALHTGRTAIVISPLISLMQDQCAKLNNRGLGADVACFLGSAQLEAGVEERALRGDFRIVFATPEKSTTSWFLDALAQLHARRGLSLIAVDEAHCISEWGHDFRAAYRELGNIRAHAGLSGVPLVALTATAVARVQHDITDQLGQRDPLRSTQSFDRPNLAIAIERKSSLATAMAPLVDSLRRKPSNNSSIIYAPTRNSVMEVAGYLEAQLRQRQVRVVAYHAGLTHQQRSDAHTDFLTGAAQVIVATVAFGMGIDKPDTRRVVHWGNPKTVEEYYQQIGRAGRDGLPAEVTLFFNDNDFARYRDDFYVGSLSAEARRATLASLDALERFANSRACRRREILAFFDETPSFGERCGTCDNCRNAVDNAGDLVRDFTEEAALLLFAVAALSRNGRGAAASAIEGALAGKTLEGWRYSPGFSPAPTAQRIREQRGALPPGHGTTEFLKELLVPLVESRLIERRSESSSHSSKKYSVFAVTSRGNAAATQFSRRQRVDPIELPVPSSLRRIERERQQKRDARIEELQQAGVDTSAIPRGELEAGRGPVLSAHQQWIRTLKRAGELDEQRGTDRAAQLGELRARILQWRAQMATGLRMAPASVLAEHLVLQIAYVSSTTPLSAEGLRGCGVRSSGVDELAGVLASWCGEFGTLSQQSVGGVGDDGGCAGGSRPAPMELPDHDFCPSTSWKHAVYKPNKKTGLATWEDSWSRFVEREEHPDSIAVRRATGKAIKPATVVSHCFDGLANGRRVPLRRLAEVVVPPNEVEWQELEKAEVATGIDVVETAKVLMGEFLRPIVGDALIDTPYAERSEAEQAAMSRWFDRVKWYFALRRTGFQPTFSYDAAADNNKRQRVL